MIYYTIFSSLFVLLPLTGLAFLLEANLLILSSADILPMLLDSKLDIIGDCRLVLKSFEISNSPLLPLKPPSPKPIGESCLQKTYLLCIILGVYSICESLSRTTL